MPAKLDGPIIITLDVETLPITAWVWGLFDQNIGLDMIKEDWTIASYCWKELGKPKIHYKDCRNAPRNDRALMDSLWHALDRADIVVGHNMKKFDLRKIYARLIMAGFPPPSPVKAVDTLVEAKKIAAFTSNRLAWLSKHLTDIEKDKHTDFPGFELWKACMAGNKKAWNSMKKYNPIDVESTEKLYLKLRPWMKGHPNMGNYDSREQMCCTNCGSTNLQYRGRAVTQTGVYQRVHCTDCGKWMRTRRTENTRAKRNLLLGD